jgi:hypothetical protein
MDEQLENLAESKHGSMARPRFLQTLHGVGYRLVNFPGSSPVRFGGRRVPFNE